MMVLCNDIGMVEHARRRSGLPNATIVMEHDNNKQRNNHRCRSIYTAPV